MSQKAMMQHGWNLLEHGLLWKEVVKSAADQQSFGKQAEEFVKQLQETTLPKNALEGLLLDRMASSYLRKVMLLEEQAAYKDDRRDRVRARYEGRAPEDVAKAVLLDTSPSTLLHEGYAGVMQYESILDRGFHRDTFLLLQLQQLYEQSTASSTRKPQSTTKTIVEGNTKKRAID